VASPSTLPGRCERNTADANVTEFGFAARARSSRCSNTAAAPSFGEHNIQRCNGSHTRRDANTSSAVLRSHLPGSVLGEATPLAGIDDAQITPPSALAAQAAYAEAGIGPDDVDLVECQDTDAARELLAWEELGLCRPGDQPKILADGDATLSGRRPVNPSGGLLSKGEPLGASALGQVVELVMQLRGVAGNRQVPNAKVGLAHTVGRGANASVTIVKR
jgi:acetyl-CoA acetyltransferase